MRHALAGFVLLAACSQRVALPGPTLPLTPSPDAPFRAAVPLVEPTPPSVPDVHSAELPNGMRILVVERPALPLVTLVWASQAARDGDAPHEAGLAALTANALTEGTRLSNGQELAYLRLNGETPGVGVTGDGSFVSLHVPKRDLRTGVDTLAAIVRRPLLTAPGIQAARIDQLEAMNAQSLTISYQLKDAALFGLFGDEHPKVSYLGSHADVVAFTQETVSRFYAAHYAPESSALIAVGATTLEEVVALATTHFGDWSRSTASLPAQTPAAPPTPLAVSKPIQGLLADGDRAWFAVAMPCPTAGDPREADFDLLSMVFANLPLSRTARLLRHDEGISYAVHAYCDATRRRGIFWVQFAVEAERCGDALHLVLNEIKRLRTEEVPAAELELAKIQLLGHFGGELSTNTGIAWRLASAFARGLPPSSIADFIEQVRSATSARIRESARLHWTQHIGVATYGPGKTIDYGLMRFGATAWSRLND